MTVELKSCPFCGGKAKLDENSVWDGSYYTYCTKCFAMIDNELPKQQAISAWNHRVDQQAEAAKERRMKMNTQKIIDELDRISRALNGISVKLIVASFHDAAVKEAHEMTITLGFEIDNLIDDLMDQEAQDE